MAEDGEKVICRKEQPQDRAERSLLFSNSAMFSRVMSDPELFRELAEVVTGVRLKQNRGCSVEQTIDPALGSRGVRMDVIAADDGRVIDIEMQARLEPDLGKRLRYYQSALDVHHLGKGEGYGALPESFIVFICTFDAFGLGLPAYHLERSCVEGPVSVGDESHWVVLNASAYEGETRSDLAAVLEYVATGNVRRGDAFVVRIDEAVQCANGDYRWVDEVYSVMGFEENLHMRYKNLARKEVEAAKKEMLAEGLAEGRAKGLAEGRAEGHAEGRAEGLAEGRAEGHADIARLAQVMKADGREGELLDALPDQEKMAALMSEYGL